jgi:ATP-dependent Lhr-like helicase
MTAGGRHPTFPIVLETYRECLQDVFDLPALVELLAAIRRKEVRVVEVETPSASPFARSLAFAYVAAFMYEGDSPLAERKAQALTLDRNLLRELLGQEELADLLDAAVLDEVEAELQGLEPERRAHHADALHDLLRRVGDLTPDEITARTTEDPAAWLTVLTASWRAALVRVASEPRFIAAEDIGRYRDALGVQPPAGTPAVFLEPAPDALLSLVARWARTHGPFTSDRVASRFALSPAQVEPALRALVAEGRLLEGSFRANVVERQWCDAEVLRTLRRRTLGKLRNQVAPVEAEVLGRFLIGWHGVSSAGAVSGAAAGGRGGTRRLREVVAQLEGVFLPFSDLEGMILPARVSDFNGGLLDELGALGEVCWIGAGALGRDDGRVGLFRRDRVRLLFDAPTVPADTPPLHRALLDALESEGASFFAQLRVVAGPDTPTDDIRTALWDLVWAGLVTNDTFQPLRALSGGRRPAGVRPGRGERSWAAMAQGRWSTVASLLGGPASETERLHARALMLLERYGVVSREAVAAEGLPGGYTEIAPVLRAMEDAGKIRRGYFVEGLTGTQYAQAGAVDRLRAARDPMASDRDGANDGDHRGGDDVLTLAAVDPANPYGALLPWPLLPWSSRPGAAAAIGDAVHDAGPKPGQRGDGDGHADAASHADADGGGPGARRAAGARVVLVRGLPVLFVERGGRGLRVFSEDAAAIEAAVVGLRQAPRSGRRRRPLRIEKVNGVPALRSALVVGLRRAGFRLEPGGLVLDPVDARG